MSWKNCSAASAPTSNTAWTVSRPAPRICGRHWDAIVPSSIAYSRFERCELTTNGTGYPASAPERFSVVSVIDIVGVIQASSDDGDTPVLIRTKRQHRRNLSGSGQM